VLYAYRSAHSNPSIEGSQSTRVQLAASFSGRRGLYRMRACIYSSAITIHPCPYHSCCGALRIACHGVGKHCIGGTVKHDGRLLTVKGTKRILGTGAFWDGRDFGI
jgi:hypothetical protein